jgi:MFS family permease
MFYGSFILLAFGAGGCTSVVTMTAVANWFKKNVGIAFAVMASGFGASGLIVPLIVRLIDGYGWRTALIILGLGMWALGIPLSFVIRNKPEQYGYLPDGKLADGRISEYEIQHEKVEISFRKALKKRSFLYLNLAEVMRFMVLTAVVLHIMPYLGSMGMSRPTAGLVAAAIPLFSIIGRFGFGWLGDVFDKRYVIAVTFGFMGMGMLAFSHMQATWAIYLFLFLFSPGFGGGSVLRGAVLREYFGRDSFGKMIGILMGFASIGGIIGPTLAGWVFDTLGSYDFIWLVFAGCMSLGIILALRIKA